MIDIPLMKNNVEKSDIDTLIDFLRNTDRFTQGPKVKEFEDEWSKWLGVTHSIFVNSGSSANFMTMAGIKELYGNGEVILSPLGWSSDVSSVIVAGFDPVFVDVKLEHMAMNEEILLSAITPNTRAVLFTHVLGFNGLSKFLIDELNRRNILLIEDICESHGANIDSRKCGSIGFASNCSFYYAHHMSTIEGGMISTNDDEFYRTMKMYRSHGMLRECGDEQYKKHIIENNKDLHSEFIFMLPGYNMRSTELNAVIGLNQIRRLDKNIIKRKNNYKLFLENLDENKFFTSFNIEGSSNYAFTIILQNKDAQLYERMIKMLDTENVEYRRGTAGGGNLIRQPFVKKRYPNLNPKDYPVVEHIHDFGVYTGNYPELEEDKILSLCEALNKL